VPDSLKEQVKTLTEGAEEDKPTYKISEKEAEKLKDQFGDSATPLVETKTGEGIAPQFLLVFLNNGAFLLSAIIPGGALIFAAVLFANLKILPKGMGESLSTSLTEDDLPDIPTNVGAKKAKEETENIGNRKNEGEPREEAKEEEAGWGGAPDEESEEIKAKNKEVEAEEGEAEGKGPPDEENEEIKAKNKEVEAKEVEAKEEEAGEGGAPDEENREGGEMTHGTGNAGLQTNYRKNYRRGRGRGRGNGIGRF
jgi:hypothetical protein